MQCSVKSENERKRNYTFGFLIRVFTTNWCGWAQNTMHIIHKNFRSKDDVLCMCVCIELCKCMMISLAGQTLLGVWPKWANGGTLHWTMLQPLHWTMLQFFKAQEWYITTQHIKHERLTLHSKSKWNYATRSTELSSVLAFTAIKILIWDAFLVN